MDIGTKWPDTGQRTAVFAIMSDTDKSFSFLHAIMMWQSIDILCRRALEKYNGKLPTMVNFIFDEFANIGTIPDIEPDHCRHPFPKHRHLNHPAVSRPA